MLPFQEHPDELGSDPFVVFVSQMLHYLAQRIALGGVSPPPLATASTSALSSPTSCGRVLGLTRRGGRGAGSDHRRRGRAGSGGGGGFGGHGGVVVREGASGELGLAALEDGAGVEGGDRG